MAIDIALVVSAWCGGIAACALGLRPPSRLVWAPPMVAFGAMMLGALTLIVLGSREAPEGALIAAVLAFAAGVMSLVIATEAADRRRGDDGEEGGWWWPGFDDRPRPQGPTPDPAWWPEFERELRDYMRKPLVHEMAAK